MLLEGRHYAFHKIYTRVVIVRCLRDVLVPPGRSQGKQKHKVQRNADPGGFRRPASRASASSAAFRRTTSLSSVPGLICPSRDLSCTYSLVCLWPVLVLSCPSTDLTRSSPDNVSRLFGPYLTWHAMKLKCPSPFLSRFIKKFAILIKHDMHTLVVTQAHFCRNY